MDDLDQWMEATKTHPQLHKEIIAGLTQWHDQTPISRPSTEESLAGQLQDGISWGLALEGCIAKRWQEEQDMYWKAFKLRKSSKCWTTALLK